MARNLRTPEQFESIASQLDQVSVALREIASSMRTAEMPTALVHVTLPENTHLPAIVDWADKLAIDVRVQLRAYLAGVQSDVERRKQYNDAQKLAAAKKPWPKKATKKKAT